jgi:hypothetical protein
VAVNVTDSPYTEVLLVAELTSVVWVDAGLTVTVGATPLRLRPSVESDGVQVYVPTSLGAEALSDRVREPPGERPAPGPPLALTWIVPADTDPVHVPPFDAVSVPRVTDE